jgi:hypothetical protein
MKKGMLSWGEICIKKREETVRDFHRYLKNWIIPPPPTEKDCLTRLREAVGGMDVKICMWRGATGSLLFS